MSRDYTKTQSYVGPFITMVVLMALIGFVTSINQQFQAPIQAAFLKEAGSISNTLTTLLVFAFFLAYLVVGPFAARYLEKHGYKQSLLTGVAILACSVLLFLVSAVQFERWPYDFRFGAITLPLSYFIFIFGSFISGTGLTFLQASVNPYLVVCDVRGTSAIQRQNIGGTGNSIMTTLGPLFVAYTVFGGKGGKEVAIGSIYLPMSLLVVFFIVLFFIVSRLHLPDLANTTAVKGEKLDRNVLSFRHLALGVVGIFCYVGVEVCIGSNINLFAADHGVSGPDAARMASLYWLGLLIGRFFSSFMSRVSARLQLGVCAFVAAAFVAAAMITENPWVLVAVGLFHSVMWGAVFALALEKLGKYTAKGTGALMMGVVGGAVLPFLQGILADISGGWNKTWIIVILGELYLLSYALWGSKVRQSNS